VVDGSIFPKGSDFVDNGDSMSAAGSGGRQTVQSRRVGMDYIRRKGLDSLIDPTPQVSH